MRVEAFDFELPEDLIALRPANPRDSARLMVVHGGGRIEHARVSDLPAFLKKGDVLVANDTKVIAARLRGIRRRDTDANVEILLHRRLSPDSFSVLVRPARKLVVGDKLIFGDLEAQVIARGEAGAADIAFSLSGAGLDAAIARLGEIPLPPYIMGKRKTDAADAADYQTMFAQAPGSVAAPTAGLHFTDDLLARLAAAGIARETLTLHVGLGTFLPVSADDTADHRMHPERAELKADMAARLNQARAVQGRIAAVGTTSLRTLESATGEDGVIHAFAGDTDIFITPGYRFRAADILLTNFHLPRSTLFMLVSAFMGLEVMRSAYREAIAKQYRFYSYGDACLLLP